jgi:HAE1 family hydrophobic/amphiphilic exporter-1
MSLPKLAVLRPITTSMLIVSVLVVGGIALVKLPHDYLPKVDAPFIEVEIPYPNSNPTQIEREIAKPVEEVLSTLPSVKKLTSVSTADGATIDMEFNWGEDLDLVRMQVSEKMDQIEPELPANIGEILIFSFSTEDMPVMEARLSAAGVDLSENYELIETRIVNRLRRVPGVARVDLGGVEPAEIRIDLILDKVRAHNVDVSALIGILQGASQNMVLGQVDRDGLRFSARALGGFKSVAEIHQMTINDQGLRLGDIAEIAYEEPPLTYGRHLDGTYAVALTIYKESTANTVDVVENIFQVVDNDINDDPLLQGIELFVWEDQGKEISNAIGGLAKAGLIGALLSIITLYFFLRRFDSTLIVAMCIPFSLLATCGVLFFMGKSLNMLSAMGLMISIGMLVDNAVVVLESIDRVHRTEEDPAQAALKGSKQVAIAVAASTATTLIVFLPLVVGGKTDLTTWLQEVGIALSIALTCSLLASLMLIPLMSAHFLKRKKTKPIRFMEWLEKRYAGLLDFTLRRRVITALILVAALVVGLLPFFTGMVDNAIFAATVNDRIFVMYEFADFTFKSDAEDFVDLVEAAIEPHREEFFIKSVYSYYAENDAATVLNLNRSDLGDDAYRELQKNIRERLPELPGVRLMFNDSTAGGGSTTQFAVRLFGQDTGQLKPYAEEAMRRLEGMDGIQDVRNSLRGTQREVRVSVNREKPQRLGLTAGDISDIFSFTLGSMRLQRFNAGEREVETWLALRLEDRQDIEDLKALSINQVDGRPVLLGDVAEFQIVPRANEIRRENRKARVSVTATYEGEDWETSQESIATMMDSFELPPGTSWSWNDRIIEQQDQNAQMGINFLLALVLVYLVMASLFESLAQPFAILFSILFALPGAAWMMAITGTPFNLMGQIGFLVLMGIVVNNGIVLLDYMNQLRRQGYSDNEAVLAAGRARLRPILMTASTTIIGLVPLALPGSTLGGLFYYPMARTVIGGLMSSAIFTLLVLPYLTLFIEAIARWFKRIWHGSASLQPLPLLADEPERRVVTDTASAAQPAP